MDGEVSPRPRNKRLTASKEPPKHNAVGNVLLQSWKKKKKHNVQWKLTIVCNASKDHNFLASKAICMHRELT